MCFKHIYVFVKIDISKSLSQYIELVSSADMVQNLH